MLVPYGKDRIAVSDIADYVGKYDWTMDDFQINQGESDDLIRFIPGGNRWFCVLSGTLFTE
jgi:hypothetical protein